MGPLALHQTNMSDIVCRYVISNREESSGYFLVEPHVRLAALREILAREYLDGRVEHPPTIISRGEVLRTDNQLREHLKNEPVEFTLMESLPESDAVQQESCEPAQENQEQDRACEDKDVPQEEPVEDSWTLGPCLQQILASYGITVKPGDDPMEVIKSLPPPLPRMIMNKGQKCLKNPKFAKCVAKRLAKRFDLPKHELKVELRDALEHADFLRDISPKKESRGIDLGKEPIQAPLNPRCARLDGKKKTIHQATCDECNQTICGVRYKCLVCPDFDLCETCEASNNSHPHVFAKLYKQRDYQTVQTLTHPVDNFRGCPPLFARREHPKVRLESLEASVQKLQDQVAGLMAANRIGEGVCRKMPSNQ